MSQRMQEIIAALPYRRPKLFIGPRPAKKSFKRVKSLNLTHCCTLPSEREGAQAIGRIARQLGCTSVLLTIEGGRLEVLSETDIVDHLQTLACLTCPHRVTSIQLTNNPHKHVAVLLHRRKLPPRHPKDVPNRFLGAAGTTRIPVNHRLPPLKVTINRKVSLTKSAQAVQRVLKGNKQGNRLRNLVTVIHRLIAVGPHRCGVVDDRDFGKLV